MTCFTSIVCALWDNHPLYWHYQCTCISRCFCSSRLCCSCRFFFLSEWDITKEECFYLRPRLKLLASILSTDPLRGEHLEPHRAVGAGDDKKLFFFFCHLKAQSISSTHSWNRNTWWLASETPLIGVCLNLWRQTDIAIYKVQKTRLVLQDGDWKEWKVDVL